MSRLSRVLLSAMMAVVLHGSAWAQTWEKVNEADGVVVSKMKVEDSAFVKFKGETSFDAPPEKVLYVLMDNEHRPEWIARLAEIRILERMSDWEYVLYQSFDLPSLFSDRDYVYHGRILEDEATGVITLKMNSVDHPKAPPTVGVRANLIDSSYVLTPVDGGKRTEMVVTIHTDPMGMMPVWLVNMIQKSWPVKTLNGIRTQLKQPYTKNFPLPSSVKAAEPEPVPAEEAAPVDEAPAEEAAPADEAAE